jgi:type II secretory pathway pseudopilin PulG
MNRSRGFTLVELMVAITGGLFMSVIVFVLARDGSRFYQRESRVANATLAGIVGFERLRAELTRAGFLTSPNVRGDPGVCGSPTGGNWPAELAQMASLRITPGGSPPNATNLVPDQIVLAGSFTSADQFPIRCVIDTGAGFQVFLQQNSGAMARLGYLTAAPAAQLAVLGTVFGVGRALRIVDKTGRQHFGVITAVTQGGGGEPIVSLATAPALRFRSTGGALCGLKGCETGALANVVNFVQYDIRNLADNSNLGGENLGYAAVYAEQAAPGDAQRTDLVRVELDASGTPIPDTEELVAEYAVDLAFGLTVAENFINGTNPTLRTIAPGDGEITNWAGSTVGLAANRGPQLVKAVRFRLSVRSREADREADIVAGPTVAAGLYRIGIGQGGGAPFARVRTLQADIAMRNQMAAAW